MFRQAGYGTVAFVSSRGLGPERGIDAEFEVFDAPRRVRNAFATASRMV